MVLVALKRSSSELSSYQKKILPVDDHVGVAIAGLTSDGRRLRYVCVCVWGGGSQDISGGRLCGRVRVVGMEECSVPVWEESGRWEVLYLGEGVCVCGESSSSSAASS